jgi:hypothetical protein
MSWLDGVINWLAGWFASSENETVKAVRDATVILCGFLPTVETVAALIAVNNPAMAATAAPAVLIAKKICTAVKAPRMQSLLGGDAQIIVDGIVIEGEFVNPKE